jgi:hypothetical protein
MLKGNIGAILTGVIIVVGAALVVPQYYRSYYEKYYKSNNEESATDSIHKLILAFNIDSESNMPKWCNDLFYTMRKHDLKGAIFLPGYIAEKYPKCVNLFSSYSNNIDVGSQTYSYVNITSIPDYTVQLNEVRNGKTAVDNAGRINSSLFKAPYGSTDENIYSLLEESGILADFSYTGQYNKYEDGEFIKYDLIAFNGSISQSEILNGIKSKPVLINFDNLTPVSQIDSFISQLKNANRNIQFMSPSELTGIELNTK